VNRSQPLEPTSWCAGSQALRASRCRRATAWQELAHPNMPIPKYPILFLFIYQDASLLRILLAVYFHNHTQQTPAATNTTPNKQECRTTKYELAQMYVQLS
jgi:hypothetical protein